MRLRELITESAELDSTLKRISHDTGSQIAQLYKELEHTARSYVNKNMGDDPTTIFKKLKFILGQPKGKYMQGVYVLKLEKDLYHLCEYAPHATSRLKALLREFWSDPEFKKSFNNLESLLPEILLEIGQQLKANQLIYNAKEWISSRERLYNLLDKLNKQANEAFDTDIPQTAPKSKSTGGQYNQVETIVNDVLKSLNPKVANEIRSAIARSDNKLAALQAELQKRNIQV